MSISGRSRRRRRRQHRWSAEEKARYLDAFWRSELSGVAFCREMDLSPATLRSENARHGAADERVSFARVEVVPTNAPALMPTGEPRAGMRLVVRGTAGHEAALDGVDAVTAGRLV